MPLPDAARTDLRDRLEAEFDDAALAAEIVDTLADDIVEALTASATGTTPLLSYRPTRSPDAQIGSLWVLAFGYRFVDGASTRPDDAVPPRAELLPGPINEDLARQVATFVAHTPVPVIAQWEVADVLQALWVPDVIPVDPDIDDAGTVTYLSTVGVIEKGRRLAEEAGVEIGTPGVLGHADHVSRVLLTMEAAGLSGTVPETVRLPSQFDPDSGQRWTRSRSAYLPLDLLARAHLS